MGNCVFQEMKEKAGEAPVLQNVEDLLIKNNFEKQYVVGRGGFGRVWKVASKKQKQTQAFAIKEMSKARIIAKKSLASILMERTILSELSHHFLINMVGAFQDRENLYLVLDYCSGGDLRYHLPSKCFNEEETKFMIACLLLGLEHSHSKKVVHRDIKPENLVFDQDGYLKLTDFGIARKLEDQGVVESSGTPGYMSPEAMCRLPHGLESDFFAVGVLVFEMMFRRRPYWGQNKNQIRDNMLAKQVQIRAHEIPPEWSVEAADFTNKLIRRKPENRLGFKEGVQELKNHYWFKAFDWDSLEKKTMKAPWVPPKGDNFQGKQVEFQGEDKELLQEAESLVRRETVQKLFEGYYFDNFVRPNIKRLASVKQKALEQQQPSRNQEQLAKVKLHGVKGKLFGENKNIAIRNNQVKDWPDWKTKAGSPAGSFNSSASTGIGSIGLYNKPLAKKQLMPNAC